MGYIPTPVSARRGGGSWYNLPGRGGPEGDPGSDYVAYVVFSAVLLVDCAI